MRQKTKLELFRTKYRTILYILLPFYIFFIFFIYIYYSKPSNEQFEFNLTNTDWILIVWIILIVLSIISFLLASYKANVKAKMLLEEIEEIYSE